MISAFCENYPFVEKTSLAGIVKDISITVTYSDKNLLPLRVTHIDARSGVLITLQTDSGNTFSNSSNTITISLDETVSSAYETTYCSSGNQDFDVSLLIAADYHSELSLDNGELDIRTIILESDRVNSIQVITSFDPEPVIADSAININEGYNVSFQLYDDNSSSVRPATVIEVSAIPGAGAGRVAADCSSSGSVLSLNGIAPKEDSSNVFLSGDDCYSLYAGEHSVNLRNDCTACCKCQDFTDAGLFLDALASDYYKAGAKLDYVRDELTTLISRWNSDTCTEDPGNMVDVQLLISPVPFGVALITFRNTLDHPINNVYMDVSPFGLLDGSNGHIPRYTVPGAEVRGFSEPGQAFYKVLYRNTIASCSWADLDSVMDTSLEDIGFWSYPSSEYLSFYCPIVPPGFCLMEVVAFRLPLIWSENTPMTFSATAHGSQPDQITAEWMHTGCGYYPARGDSARVWCKTKPANSDTAFWARATEGNVSVEKNYFYTIENPIDTFNDSSAEDATRYNALIAIRKLAAERLGFTTEQIDCLGDYKTFEEFYSEEDS